MNGAPPRPGVPIGFAFVDKVTAVDERVADEQRGQQIAVGGVRTQAIGLVLVALGLVLQS